jgi:hypothetical protein
MSDIDSDLKTTDEAAASAGSKPNRSPRFLSKLAVFSVTSVICLLLLEWAVRIALPYYHPGRQTPFHLSEEGVVLGSPSETFHPKTPKGDWNITVAFNQYGLRDPKDLKQAKANDIFVAGDSFSIGWGVEEQERYSNVLEKDLRLPIYNIAIPEDIRGYIATVKYAERLGAKIHNLIIGLCMENDLWDYTNLESTHARMSRQMNASILRKVCGWFKMHSALWICASYQIQQSSLGRTLFEKLGIAKNIETLTHKNEYSEKVLAASRDELLKLATNYNSVVVVIPSRGLWHGQNVVSEKKIHDEMVSLLRNSNLQVLDMRPLFEKTGNPLQYYFATDPHWNAAGHKVAGDALAEYLQAAPSWKPVFQR